MNDAPQRSQLLRSLPAVDEVLRSAEAAALLEAWPRARVTDVVREVLDGLRRAILDTDGEDDVPGALDVDAVARTAATRLADDARPTHERAINGTGVVIHTGLGRSALPRAAVEALAREAAGYAVVEVDRRTGERNRREERIAALLRELTGAEAATVVNNNAAATLIALAALAAGREAIVSRGQLVEIGGSYRIPDVMEQSGAILRDVGCTNKTRMADYEAAIGDATGLLLRVHTSNYRIVGFTAEASLEELVELGARRGLPVMDDLGSGCLVDALGDEPPVSDSVRAGADVVTFSGDKLLGGPQAGLIVGKKAAVERIRKHPLYRAIRPGKLTLIALEATLRLYRDPDTVRAEVPTLAQLAATPADLEPRAAALAAKLGAVPALSASVEEGVSQVGGGALPTHGLPTRLVALQHATWSAGALAAALRETTPPVFTRIHADRVLIDLRTILPDEDELLAAVVGEALAPAPRNG